VTTRLLRSRLAVQRLLVGHVATVALAALAAGCARPEPLGGDGAAPPAQARPAGPYLRALGTAQDGGLPQTACSCERCDRARRDPAYARRVASLAVVLPASRKVFLVDATPDLPEQIAALADVRDALAGAADRSPVDGVLLTHAHMGHYLGLAHLGFEAVNTHGTPVWCTPRMAAFLRGNGPWSQLVSLGNVAIHEVEPVGIAGEGAGGVAELGDGVVAEALAVPHRDELSDTVAWRMRGPSRTVLYVPDVDGWEEWGGLARALEGVDVAIVDGTFYSDHELGDRDVSKIGHPRIAESLARFGAAVRAGRLEVAFTHLNHSNPALDPASAENRAIEDAGFRVLRDGEEIGL
jgi:pyrroloquinoline quinone biosynthesis protein B